MPSEKSESVSFAGEVEAVSFDVLGTLLRLEDPAPRLRHELSRLAGVDVAEDRARRAFRCEMRYYVDHHLQGRDSGSLAELRDACAAVVLKELGLGVQHHSAVRRALLCSLSFTPYPDVLEALRELRARGLRLVAVSNWDCSLQQVLERTGLLGFLDGAVSSAQVGAAKPAPQVFSCALALVGCEPGRALHVGDSRERDVLGARTAGMRAVMLQRDAAGCDEQPRAGVKAIHTLRQLAPLTLRL